MSDENLANSMVIYIEKEIADKFDSESIIEEFKGLKVLQTILDHVVIPKLSDAVDSWDPRQDTIPIHVWIHPWLVLLGHKLEVLYPTIRTKLEHVLCDWYPSDASAYTVLSPWKDVFNRRTWEQMMINCIAPKLLVVMSELEINPADQKLEHFYWVQTWVGLIPVDHMLQIMDVFFDKWQMALYQWLCSNPNYQEVNDWFVGWRNLIPSEILSTERVRCQLKVGLDMMNQAVEGFEVVEPGLRENLSDINARNQSQFLAQQKAASAAQAAQTGMNDMSLKEVIEVHAQDKICYLSQNREECKMLSIKKCLLKLKKDGLL
ncbi:GC-rich sequence DNA-binding factor domain-containing protein [Artemisia annua]|uniref:GC-rich sequence DNA-binding factor domain-containing protein n=1 Tax=Artemisia annua TaxID=35608 RepID=A0A2U1MNR4_ARTAN|nr:GC-rich sequence DNA-binding factor domain-containing protein [Artemisia annua]